MTTYHSRKVVIALIAAGKIRRICKRKPIEAYFVGRVIPPGFQRQDPNSPNRKLTMLGSIAILHTSDVILEMHRQFWIHAFLVTRFFKAE